jgi:membrane fusion protein (multidrug efflux system)
MNVTNTASPSRRLATHIVTILLVLCILTAIGWGIYTYYELDRDLYTNDAQVEEYITPVNTRITGYIREIRFTDHQRVKKGDTLVIIDDREFKIAAEQAEAAWLSARAARNVTASAVTTVHSGLGVTDANIRALDVRIWNAEQNFHRFENLLKADAATQQEFDQIKTEYASLLEQRDALVRQKQTTNLSTEETNKKVPVNDAEIKRAHAVIEMAGLNLSYTVITAPYDGVTGRRMIQEGQAVTAGQTLLSFVRSDSKWIVANYKETQVTHLRVGQKMILFVDGFDGKKFEGVVSAISEATGARYSAIPVDNSTGNFVKVRQRVPVRIEFSSANKPRDLEGLIAGMNVEVRTEDKK